MFLLSSKYPILEGDTMLIEHERPKNDYHERNPDIPESFVSVGPAAKLVCQFALDGDMVSALDTFRTAHDSGFTIAAVCERACRFITRAYDFSPEMRKHAIKATCERATRLARLYGELRRNRRYEWR